VDESLAFQTIDRSNETFERIQASGAAYPWILPMGSDLQLCQAAYSWIWGAGGELVSSNGKEALFMQPQALDGLKAYFGLHRFMPPLTSVPEGLSALQLFVERKVAVAMGNIGPLTGLLHNASQDVLDRLGLALPPRPPYIGGSNLVIWKHTRREIDVLELVRFLLSPKAQEEAAWRFGYLPVQVDVLASPRFAGDPNYQGFIRALEKGRPFPDVKFGGLLEERLASAIGHIWKELFKNPSADVNALLARDLPPIARRFERLVSQA
jgi:multiple sugar transport system substrate-binding protein